MAEKESGNVTNLQAAVTNDSSENVERFKNELKALWDCDYAERKYSKLNIDDWKGQGQVDSNNFWVCKGVVDCVKRAEQNEEQKKKKDKKEESENANNSSWKVWKTTAKSEDGKSYDEILKEHNKNAEGSYYYYLAQKNVSINGKIQPSGIGIKLFIDKDKDGKKILTTYKYCDGDSEICKQEDLQKNGSEFARVNKIIEVIKAIKEAKTQNQFERIEKYADNKVKDLNDRTDDRAQSEKNIEKIKNIPSALRHKLMMVRALEIYRDEKVTEKINLLFVDKGIDKYYNDYIKKYYGGNADNWVTKNIELTKKLAEIIGIQEKDMGYENIKKLSGLLWDYEHRNELFKEIGKCKQIIYTGAPGTGKTYGIRRYVKYLCMLDKIDETVKSITGDDIKQYKFIQFHSTYDYSDFVEGLRPAKLNDKANDTTFVRMDGVFKSFCRDVVQYNKVKNTDKKFYFIIDEINRADLGKVFGELMYALEEDYRGEKNPVDTQYRNLPTYYYDKRAKTFKEIPDDKDSFKDGFYIPENVYIIGSMNDIDRSVETFDFALRRRFKWININANDVMENTLRSIFNFSDSYSADDDADDKDSKNGLFKTLVNNIKNLNKVISGESGDECNGAKFRLNDSYQIGPAYFQEFAGTPESLDNIWKEKVEPILREYVRGYEKEEIESFINTCHDRLIDKNIKDKMAGFEAEPETHSNRGD